MKREFLERTVEKAKNQSMLRRFYRRRDAHLYLGMDRNRFDKEVRPYLTEIPIGTQGIAFDRLEMDVFADDYKSRNGRPPKKEAIWHNENPQD